MKSVLGHRMKLFSEKIPENVQMFSCKSGYFCKRSHRKRKRCVWWMRYDSQSHNLSQPLRRNFVFKNTLASLTSWSLLTTLILYRTQENSRLVLFFFFQNFISLTLFTFFLCCFLWCNILLPPTGHFQMVCVSVWTENFQKKRHELRFHKYSCACGMWAGPRIWYHDKIRVLQMEIKLIPLTMGVFWLTSQ